VKTNRSTPLLLRRTAWDFLRRPSPKTFDLQSLTVLTAISAISFRLYGQPAIISCQARSSMRKEPLAMESPLMFRKSLARLHKDEQGIEALQAVLIMAIAAVILAVVKLKWPAIKAFFNKGADDAVTFDN
jgi:hypothetical protein